ncbi:MAG: sigma-54-dependent Fis family transcriptional regulator, partial [Chitinophagales bacterium]|nr:sigma-54-dependent Fis family transcriptional regulator [Chitinophagales bacterium]
KNIIKRATLLADGKLDVKGLPFELVNHARLTFDEPATTTATPASNVTTSSTFTADKPAEVYKAPLTETERVVEPPRHEEPKTINLKKAAQEAEYETILDALKKADFNKSKAAEILGIDRKTLYNKMKRINVER